MPQLICNTCRVQTVQAYNFKSLCKKSDDALKIFLATGILTKPTLSPSSAAQTNPVILVSIILLKIDFFGFVVFCRLFKLNSL